MSLINQVLNDLDARNASAGQPLPNEIRALPHRSTTSKRVPLVAGGVLLLAMLGGGAGWLFQQRADRTMPLASAPVTPPAPGLPVAADVAARPLESATTAEASSAAADDGLVRPADGREPELRISSMLSSPPPSMPEPARARSPGEDAGNAVHPEAARARPPAPKPVPGASPAPAAGGVTAPETARGGARDGAITRQERSAEPAETAERLYRSAVATLNQGRVAEATEVLQAALRENPAHVAARQVLVKILIDGRAWDGARATLREGLERVPQHWAWALLLSRLQVDDGDAAGALKTLEGSEKVAAGSAEYQGALGAILHRLGRYAEAETRYAAAVRIDPAGGRWWVGRGMALESAGKPAEARDAYQRARSSGALAGALAAFVEQKLR